jgi:aldehyde:ferredoxin oxidoreductase
MGEGFGRICAMGVLRAKKWVTERYTGRTGASVEETMEQLNKFAMEVKGLEFSMYISKESLAQQGGYGFALKGPQHDEAWLIFIDQVHNEIPTFEMKAKALKWFPLIRTWFNAVGLCKLPWIDVRHPDAASTVDPSHNLPTLEYYIQYFNSTVGSNKTLDDILTDSERLYTLQKMINLRNGKGTRKDDMIPLRAMGPAFVNEYEARESYYDEWLKETKGTSILPEDINERHQLLVSLRKEAYERLCDTVYMEKGYDSNGVPLAETVDRLELMDNKAKELLRRNGVDSGMRLVSN